MLELYNNRIRPIAISIVRNNNNILVYEREDDITKEKFYRLVGGCIEFSEESSFALKREFMEELSIEIISLELLSIFESIFTFNGKDMHEIVFLFESKFQDKELYSKDEFLGLEGSREFKAIWMPVSNFTSNKYILYPEQAINFL